MNVDAVLRQDIGVLIMGAEHVVEVQLSGMPQQAEVWILREAGLGFPSQRLAQADLAKPAAPHGAPLAPPNRFELVEIACAGNLQEVWRMARPIVRVLFQKLGRAHACITV